MCRRCSQRMMRLCLERTGGGPTNNDSREEKAMYPGLSEADCQVAAFHYRQLVNDGQRQQISAGTHSAPRITHVVSRSLRQQIGVLLVCAGERLLGVQAVTTEGLVPTSTGEMSAIA